MAYNVTSTSSLTAPFAKIKGATIKNLHVAGTIASCSYHVAGVVSDSRSTAKIQNVWSSVTITGTSGGHDHYSGIAGCLKTGGLSISDCLFTGSIETGTYYTGNILIVVQQQLRMLSTATFNISGGGNSVVKRTATNVYYVQDIGGDKAGCTQVTSEQLSDGTTSAALNAGRAEEIWAQDPLTSQPMLKIFANAGLKANAYDGLYWTTYYCGTAGHKVAARKAICSSAAALHSGVYVNNGRIIIVK